MKLSPNYGLLLVILDMLLIMILEYFMILSVKCILKHVLDYEVKYWVLLFKIPVRYCLSSVFVWYISNSNVSLKTIYTRNIYIYYETIPLNRGRQRSIECYCLKYLSYNILSIIIDDVLWRVYEQFITCVYLWQCLIIVLLHLLLS
jgi:hypothetical protein